MAYIANKPKGFHPLLLLIWIAVWLILSLTKDGRAILGCHQLYTDHLDKMVQIGKYVIAGKEHQKISEGISVAIYPEYRKSGIYREMTRRLMENIKGYFIFHTSTESVYQAHEAMGYKKIFEVPLFYPEKHTTFVMYGERDSINI